MICTKCGKKFDDNISVCRDCGTYCGKPSSPGAMTVKTDTRPGRGKTGVKKITVAICIGIPALVFILTIVLTALWTKSNTIGMLPAGDTSPIVGTWATDEDFEYTNTYVIFDFQENGTIKISVGNLSVSGTYEVRGNSRNGKVLIKIESAGAESREELDYLLSDGQLTLSSEGTAIVFRRMNAEASEGSITEETLSPKEKLSPQKIFLWAKKQKGKIE